MYGRTQRPANGRQNGDALHHITRNSGPVTSGGSLRSAITKTGTCTCAKERSDTYTSTSYRSMLKEDMTCTPPPVMLHVFPSRLRAWIHCFFLVLVPMGVVLAMATVWLIKAKKEWDWLELRNRYVEDHLLQIVKLVINFNTERECTALYVTARDEMAEGEAQLCLFTSRSATDTAINTFVGHSWPGNETDGYMYKSKILFQAVLQRHRELVTPENDFKDELKFYTDIIHSLCGWFMRDALIWKDTQIWPYLSSYSYLLSSINLLGAEQALCSVYYTIICFSHKETFLYANYSFSGEAVFKLYRLSYPGMKDADWIHKQHSDIFPNLHTCRQELHAYVNYPGVAIDPSMCDYARKNETKVHDLDILLNQENDKLVKNIEIQMTQEQHESTEYFILILAFATCLLLYFFLVHLIRCSLIKCYQANHRNKWRQQGLKDDDKLAYVSLNEHPTIIGYDDYKGYDDVSLTPYIKVATV